MAVQIPIDPDAVTGTECDDGSVEVTGDLSYRRLSIVNVMFFGPPGAGDRGWVLIDAGVFGSNGMITDIAERRFGRGARPAAIVMTHGHFDHVGALEDLAAEWDVPVYAHPLEHPYLNGSASYPPPDPWVGGGLMALLSPLYPRDPVNVGDRLRALPDDGSVPGMPGWTWLHTPGHTPGHVSFWRGDDRTIIAGDAFITTGQESAYEVAVQRPEIHGPPRYFTPDWAAAKLSVETLAGLHPDLAVTGHGPALKGAALRDGLNELARRFDEIAVPKNGKYVEQPARAEDGSVYHKP